METPKSWSAIFPNGHFNALEKLSCTLQSARSNAQNAMNAVWNSSQTISIETIIWDPELIQKLQ